MRASLFVPCFVDQFHPDVAWAAVEVLERHGVEVDFPAQQTCCGQPLANSGCVGEARPLARRMIEVFAASEYVVAPSASCVAMVRHHFQDVLPGEPAVARLAARTFELCEFLVDVVGVEKIEGRFPHRVGLHPSCHGLRELRLAGSSETMTTRPDKVRRLLGGLEGIEVVTPARPDECCGFGGAFAVGEEAVACMMADDRIAEHVAAGADVLTAVDMSCLMHLDGRIRRERAPLKVMHVAQILAGRSPS